MYPKFVSEVVKNIDVIIIGTIFVLLRAHQLFELWLDSNTVWALTFEVLDVTMVRHHSVQKSHLNRHTVAWSCRSWDGVPRE
jgi:hypothetical protein